MRIAQVETVRPLTIDLQRFGLPLDAAHVMLNDLRAATIEQERVKLVATNEVAPARDGMARPSVLHVAARPFPDRRWIGSR